MVRPVDTRNSSSLRLASNGGLVKVATAVGPAGPNTIPTDEAIAAAVANPASDTAAALSASIARITSTDGSGGLPAPTGVGVELVFVADALDDIRIDGVSA